MKVLQWGGQGGLLWGGDISAETPRRRRSWPKQEVGGKAAVYFVSCLYCQRLDTDPDWDTWAGILSFPPQPSCAVPFQLRFSLNLRIRI